MAQTDFIDIRSSLNKVLMLPVTAATVLKDEKVDLKAWALGEATDVALKQRADLKATQERIRQQEKTVVEARAQYFPRFSVQGGHAYQVNSFTLHDTQWSVIFAMNWNIFSGLDTKAAVSQAKLKVQQLQEQHKDMNEQVQLDVQTAYLKIKETVDRIRTTETAVTQGEENLRLNEERYKESVGTATDVIDAETLLTKTRVNYWTAVYDHQMAKAQMLWAIGGINELVGRRVVRRADEVDVGVADELEVASHPLHRGHPSLLGPDIVVVDAAELDGPAVELEDVTKG